MSILKGNKRKMRVINNIDRKRAIKAAQIDPVEVLNDNLLRRSLKGPGNGMRSHQHVYGDNLFFESPFQDWSQDEWEKVFTSKS